VGFLAQVTRREVHALDRMAADDGRRASSSARVAASNACWFETGRRLSAWFRCTDRSTKQRIYRGRYADDGSFH
jgi:hypothetical protein